MESTFRHCRPQYEKNVNLEAYKLGVDQVRLTEGGSRAFNSEPPTGACGDSQSEPELEEAISKPANINVFDDIDAKGATRNSMFKIQKSTINSVIRNNLADSDQELVRVSKYQLLECKTYILFHKLDQIFFI